MKNPWPMAAKQSEDLSRKQNEHSAAARPRRRLAIAGTTSCPAALDLVAQYGLRRVSVSDICAYSKPGLLSEAPPSVQTALGMCIEAGAVRGPEVTHFALSGVPLVHGQALYFVLSQSPSDDCITAFVSKAV